MSSTVILYQQFCELHIVKTPYQCFFPLRLQSFVSLFHSHLHLILLPPEFTRIATPTQYLNTNYVPITAYLDQYKHITLHLAHCTTYSLFLVYVSDFNITGSSLPARFSSEDLGSYDYFSVFRCGRSLILFCHENNVWMTLTWRIVMVSTHLLLPFVFTKTRTSQRRRNLVPQHARQVTISFIH